MKTMAWLLCGLRVLASAPPLFAAPAQGPGLGASASRPDALSGHWFEALGTMAAPAMVLVHGLGGFFGHRGRLARVAAQPMADRQRLGMQGSSNSGRAVPPASNHRQCDVAAAPVRPSLAVARAAAHARLEAFLRRNWRLAP